MKQHGNAPETAYTRTQLLRSTHYAAHRDILTALLCAEKTYTLAQTDAIIRKFLKRKVL